MSDHSVKHPFRWLAATALLGLAVQPVLLPHPAWVQVVIGAAAAAQGYAMAAAFGLLVRRLPWTRGRFGQDHELGVAGVLSSLLLPIATVVAHHGQLAVAASTGMPGPTFLADALGVAGAVLAGVTLIGAGMGVRTGFRAAGRAIRRMPRRFAVLVLVPALLLTGSSAAVAAPDRTGEGSPVSAALGSQGAKFLGGRPSAVAISAATDRTARTPVRVYIGKDAAATPAERADLAVSELARTGGFHRATVLINVPTGSGWVNPAATESLEYLTGGNVATVAVQYAAAPSWVAYLRGGQGVQETARALIDAVRARLDRIPARQRPRLLIYGESLGAWGGLRAYDRTGQGQGLEERADGELWAGVPGPRPRPSTEMRTLVHQDDPVPAWSLRLLLARSPAWPAHWLPVVSFWQATGETMAALGVPPGYGHRYGPELVDAWRSLIPATGEPGAAPPDRLSAVRLAIG